MRLERFSDKQVEVLSWWHKKSPAKDMQAIVCDGAVRSGKTSCLSLSFVLWSFESFGNQNFALCGKTIRSLVRNVVRPLEEMLIALKFNIKLKLSQNVLEVRYKKKRNRYHLFGGKDESSAGLIQGVTLAGVLFDEVALMPRSFVEQALARCSVEGAKFWFCCNPEHPGHWFYKEWVLKAKEKNAVYLHFKMDDNPSLSPAVLERYKALYSGVFYSRYVEGLWTAAFGAVYPMFSKARHIVETVPETPSRYIVSCDYGTVNPTSMGLWGYCQSDDCWYRLREYYHCSRTSGVMLTDEEYCNELEKLVGDAEIEAVVVDPSAASFLQAVRRREKFDVVAARNERINGIRLVGSKLTEDKIKVCSCCEDAIREFGLYRWKQNSETEQPLEVDDHAMDDIRYFAMHVFDRHEHGFYAVASERKR